MPRHPPDPVVATPPSTPTRRRLITLLAALPMADPRGPAGVKPPSSPEGRDPDPVRRLFGEFQDRVAEHERAFQRCSELEARLAAEVGYSRVRLPGVADQPVRYAADLTTIDETVPPGPRRDRLHRVLLQRQARWEQTARVNRLSEAQAHEDALFDTVRDAAAALHATPATTPAGVLLKLVVLLSLEVPGQAFRDATPWRELHLILADLGRFTTVGGTDR